MSKAELESKHLAELHGLAAQAGVPGFRLLSREALVEELLVRGAGEGRPDGDGAEAEAGAPPRRPRRRPRRAPKQAQDKAEPGDDGRKRAAKSAKSPADDEGVPISGVLDVLRQGHGFVRLGGIEPDGDDVYVSASQIRRCELRPGDEVAGPAREPRRGERHRALIRVDTVNGAEPASDRASSFERLTPVTPHRRIPLHAERDDVLVRAVDLLAPLAFGQRVLIHSTPRSGRTTLLRSLVKAITAAPDPPGLIVLLVDERPEEVTEWRRQAPEAEIAAAPADLEAAEQVRHAELALARARRRVEAGEDVVVVIDSLTRLGVAHGDHAGVKPAFGAGRELEEEGAGSLTVIATVLPGTEDGDGAAEAVATTENATLALDPELAAAGIVPALAAGRCAVSGEEALREPAELEAARRLRAELAGLESAAAAQKLAERIRATETNAELLASL